jgi:nitroreductase
MDVSDIDLRSVDHVLTTTRSVRRRLDLGRLVERELIERCIDSAIQAPTALHGETWHFVVITEQSQRTAVAQIYRRAGEGHRSGALSLDPYLASLRAEKPDDPRFAAQQRMFRSGALVSNVGVSCSRDRFRHDHPTHRALRAGHGDGSRAAR